jgi:hypothetical protein
LYIKKKLLLIKIKSERSSVYLLLLKINHNTPYIMVWVIHSSKGKTQVGRFLGGTN